MPTRILLALLLLAPCRAQQAPAIFSQLDQMTAALSDITGWHVKKKVPSQVLTRDAFRRYIESHTSSKSVQKDIRAEEIALKMFGLIPQDFDLARESMDLLGEQAAAFYDYKKKRLFLLESTQGGDDQRTALVHELAHALADQQHPLGRYLEQGSPDGDAATAREAVMEGQATWLTWAYEMRRAGGKPELPPAVLEQVTRDGDPSPEFPVLSAAPLYIRQSLLFPYSAGTKFQDAVFRRSGRQAFDAVFGRSPSSTQQIIHPEEYFNAKTPSRPEPPALEPILGKESKKLRQLIDGAVGEFDHEVLLRQYVGAPESAAAAARWKGGWFRVYEHREQAYPVLAYASEWDSDAAAREYFNLYLQVLERKWKQMQMTSRTPTAVAGSGDSGRFILRVNGTIVSSIEGLR